MAGWFARCKVCNAFKSEPGECIAFRHTSDGGVAPAETRHILSSGVGCVCRNCVRVLAGQLVKVPTPPALTEPAADEGG